MRKFEYCAITGVGNNFGFEKYIPPLLLHFKTDGIEATAIELTPTGVARIIAELGDQCWEMVSCGSATTGSESVGIFHTIYFRREK